MSSKHISEILMEYERVRTHKEEEAKDRQLEIYKKIPRIKEIDTEISTLGIEVAKSVFKKDIDIEKLIENLQQKSIDLKMEKGELLSECGYALDYSTPKYICSDCQDTGYIDSKKCHCFKQKIINKCYEQSNLKEILSRENFGSFEFGYYSQNKFEDKLLSPRKNIEKIYTASVSFVDNFDSTAENLFFYGNSGLGKTFLSNCIAKDLLDRGRLVVYQTSSSLIDILRSSKFDSNDAVKDKLNDIFECDLLIIDDLGTEYTTDFSQMELYNIINKRIISGKKMLISTNLYMEELLQIYPERITSRIFGNFAVYNFYGEDIRVKIAEQKRKKNKK